MNNMSNMLSNILDVKAVNTCVRQLTMLCQDINHQQHINAREMVIALGIVSFSVASGIRGGRSALKIGKSMMKILLEHAAPQVRMVQVPVEELMEQLGLTPEPNPDEAN